MTRHYWTRKAGMVSCLACGIRISWPGAKEPCRLRTTALERDQAKAEHVSDDEARELMAVLAKETADPSYSISVEWSLEGGGKHRRSW